tara:strand:- start:340 stop:783 length:444 start_codon:yes stop_codon:yes gene_type:complete
MDKKVITFEEINFLARTIASRIEDEGITHVVGLARGGLVPATIISYKLDLPLLACGVSSYEGTKKTENFRLHQPLNLAQFQAVNAHVLVVDDICDTGDTMKWITQKLALADIKYQTACILTKEKHTKWLKHYGSVVPDDKWIVFPWE